jgi:predicted RNA binding protein YcfA (HicA-like mRNA interferase family)
MPRLPRLNGRELIQILRSHGFEVARTRGSHHSMRHSDGRYTVVPVHAGETIGVGLLMKILKDTELSKDDLKI